MILDVTSLAEVIEVRCRHAELGNPCSALVASTLIPHGRILSCWIEWQIVYTWIVRFVENVGKWKLQNVGTF